MEDIITTLNQHWPIFTGVASAVAAAVSWIISQQFSNKNQARDIKDLSDGCAGFNKRICGLEANKVEFEKYQVYAKSNRERIEMLERSDRLRAESLGLINTKLASIETDCKWLRRAMAGGTGNDDAK